MNQTVTQSLLDWYSENKRDLPWRKTKDPYAVVVSEMMLQQTQVNTVIDYYYRFLDCFPDFDSLAAADEQDVLNVWQGLGYYSRARNLHNLAKIVIGRYNGSLPGTYDALIKLPGIGPYMVGAVMSIGFDIPTPAIDGNVLRVVARIDGLEDDIAKTAARKKITERVSAILPKTRAGDFTQAMMELGAVICRPKSPDCQMCPVKTECLALQQGKTERIPVKTRKDKPKVINLTVSVVETDDKVLMHLRGHQGLLARMWGLPVFDQGAGEKPPECLSPLEGVRAELMGQISHVFSHQKWEMTVLSYPIKKEYHVEPPYYWQPKTGLSDIPVAVAFKKVLALIPRLKLR